MAKKQSVNAATHEGHEPLGHKINCKNPTYQADVMKALNWFSTYKTSKDARKYLVHYLQGQKTKKELLSGIPDLKDHEVPNTQAWLARLVDNGALLSTEHLAVLKDRCMKMFALIEAKVVIDKANAKAKAKSGVVQKTVQDYMREKIQAFLGECEGAFDDWREKPVAPTMNVKLRKEEIPAAYVPHLVAWCDEKIKEFGTVLIKPDAQLTEGYSNFSKRQLGEVVKYFGTIKSQANEYAAFKKVNKAPRKRKAKPPSVQAAKVKYLAKDDEYGLVSAHPTEMVAAQQVWLFNSKKRTLAVFNATGSTGIAIKGTTLLNYDIETSVIKKLRKPKDVLKKLQDAGKVALRRIMDDVKAKGSVPKGRINVDTVIVRVIK